MKTKILSLIILSILFSGCTNQNSPEVVSNNKYNLQNGFVIGQLADGRTVTQYYIDRGSDYPHYLYLIENSSTITVNRIARTGKVSNNQVIVIDGAEYKIEKIEK